MPLKKQIRTEFLQKRKLLTQQQVHYFVAMMLEHFEEVQMAGPAFALSYVSMSDRNEVPAHFFGETILDRFPGCQLCFPKTDILTSSMEAIADDPLLEMAPNRFGVTEPVNGNKVAAGLLDLILVPLLAFDRKGFRVGYGKGFYDRFIPQCKQNVVTIGLSFFEPVDEITDADAFDVPLKYCITPQQLYEF